MPSSWATSGVDLHFVVTGRQLRAGLEDALRGAVREGRLKPGTRLPSSRALAHDLGIARNTVAEVYAQLVAEGWLAARHGSGTWVAERPDAHLESRTAGKPEPRPPRFDLRPGTPDLGSFPRSRWAAAARRALAAAPDSALGYGDPRGLRVLREALAEYLGRARGVVAIPERIVVCAGFAHGLQLVCTALRRSGAAALAVEAHGYRRHRAIVAAAGLDPVTLPVDERGAVLDALDDQAGALLTPAHQFPTGVALDPARRRAATAWARSGAFLVEDDYDGEFRYDRQAVGAMKSLAPGVRLGWLVLPEPLVAGVVEAMEDGGAFPGTLEQLTLAHLIASGGFDRHVRRVRLEYHRRRDRLVAHLGDRVRVSGIAAGVHALVHLPAGATEAEVSARAAEHDLAVRGLSHYTAPGHPHPQALVIGYATPPAHAYAASLDRLRAVLAG